MAAAYVSEAHGAEADGTITATFGAAPTSGNLLVACLFGYAEQLSHLAAPATGLTWTERDTESDAGSTRFGKVWTATADGALSSFVFRNTNGAYDYLGLVIIEVSGHDTSTPIDAIASGKSASSDTTADCPSISPTGSDSLLIGFACHNGFTAAARTCSWSAGTERADFQRADQYDNYTAMTQALAASGATGTRTSTVSGGGEGGWLTFSVAVKSAAGGGSGATVTPAAIATSSAVQAPTVQTGSTVSPAAVATVSTLPAASVKTGSTIAAAAVATTSTVPDPAVVAVTAVSPAAIATVTAVGDAVVQTGSTVTPAAVATVSTVPDATVTVGGNATVTPVVIATSSTVPRPEVSTNTGTGGGEEPGVSLAANRTTYRTSGPLAHQL